MWLTSDELHVVLLNAPSTGGASNSTTETCKHVNMGRYESGMFIITLGTNSVTTSNFFLMEASTYSAAGQATNDYTYRVASTAAAYAGVDTLSARAAGVSTALALSSTAETMYIIEVKGSDLSAGYPFVYPSISSAAATRNAAITFIGKPRYAQAAMLQVNS
jgi:hypothetical protein